MTYISDYTTSLGILAGKIGVCFILPRTANFLSGIKEIALLQSLEQDLNAQHIEIKIPLVAGCALGLFHTEIATLINGAKEHAKQVIDKYYAHPTIVQSTVEPEPIQYDSYKEVGIHLHHNTSYEELICECHAPHGSHGDLIL